MFIYLIIIQHPNTGSKVKTIKGKNKKLHNHIWRFPHPVPLVYIAKTRQKIIKDIKDLRKAVSHHRVLAFMEHYTP